MVVKLVVDEIDSDAVEQWLASTTDDIGAPDLIAIEMAQAIVRRVNARDMSSGNGQSALRDWRDILAGRAILQDRSDPDHVERAAALAMRLGHPVKDRICLALAIEHDAELATCDAGFAGEARIVSSKIMLLADYAS